MPAPRPAIHKCSRVYGKLDPLENPTYSGSFWLAPDGRERLTTAVQAVLVSLLQGTMTTDWCPGIKDIQDNPGRYFDLARTPNDAQTDFMRDWGRVATAANCA